MNTTCGFIATIYSFNINLEEIYRCRNRFALKREPETVPHRHVAELTELTDFFQLLLHLERRKTVLRNIVYATLFKALFF